MTRQRSLVGLALSFPEKLVSLTLAEWDQLIRQARSTSLLGTVEGRMGELGLLEQVPEAARAHLDAARNLGLSHERGIRWEVHCIRKAIASVGTDIVLLKGAAYTFCGLPNARGRLQSDVDILVPKSQLKAVEAALIEHGWKGLKFEKYDQRFYRQWSHELPPLINEERGTVVDVHHNILPETGRLHPNPEKLLEDAKPILGTPYKSLSPPDMVLHASVHMFQDGDLTGGMRELVDIDALLRAFGANPQFWNELVQRAAALNIYRPLFYALRYSRLYLGTPIPVDFLVTSSEWAPPCPVLHLMDQLVSDALSPVGAGLRSGFAKWSLYVRAHWLRMPPALLGRHLAHQTFRHIRSK